MAELGFEFYLLESVQWWKHEEPPMCLPHVPQSLIFSTYLSALHLCFLHLLDIQEVL